MHGEYVNTENPSMLTNTIEGFFSIFKRGVKGMHPHCGHNHLHRYLAEFDFRYNNRKALGVEDSERGDKTSRASSGSGSPTKRLLFEYGYRKRKAKEAKAAERQAGQS